METHNNKSSKDLNAFAAIIGVGAIIFSCTTSYFSELYRMMLISCTALSFFVGALGSSRKIGFGSAFFASFFLSPIIGAIVVFNSAKIRDEAYKERMMEIAENKNGTATSVADQLHKLNELRKEGILTDEEFNDQKAVLLNK